MIYLQRPNHQTLLWISHLMQADIEKIEAIQNIVESMDITLKNKRQQKS